MKRNRGTRKLFASNQAFVFNLLTICYFKIAMHDIEKIVHTDVCQFNSITIKL